MTRVKVRGPNFGLCHLGTVLFWGKSVCKIRPNVRQFCAFLVLIWVEIGLDCTLMTSNYCKH